MTPEERQNALQSTARMCNNEIKTTLAALPANTNKDSITRPIILRHYEKIKPLGYKLAWLLFAIGVLNGQFKWNR
ncbi:TPA: hypothetical protein ACMY33_001302 [Yersinia enterocolitica]|uniref:hypothetical protein n=1 Tax=Yersinia TaxID=629 RepID=UPI0005E8701D|nr:MULTISPECIES: hypothetical protein [Yersinia]UNA05493.1 hypothetical protein vBYenM2918_003 [Yersinia phage vB_YenM_29.18]UNA05771.1 hypothetical protein vBYenM21017_003 [Yersinia phage vB_YenM_210.17]UNA05998.1 hypothetical protein vBYenM3014_003 [Yersinia phage vB_YenM_30.14]EKN3634291.1 hypothetical protein [Yersinia enterocolitica]EKN4877938.1 hypothetical protein [Yersinia enterocolitica]